jgi:hypothetical protein
MTNCAGQDELIEILPPPAGSTPSHKEEFHGFRSRWHSLRFTLNAVTGPNALTLNLEERH